MTRREQLISELRRLAKIATNIQARYGAYMSLHLAAAMNEDPVEIAERRGQLHDTLDALLDNGESLQRITNEVETLP